MLREAADRRQHFQDRFSIPRKVSCHQSLHISRNITRQITRHIARQITLQRTRQLTHNISPQIPRHTTRQIIVIIISDGFVGTVAISYQVAITSGCHYSTSIYIYIYIYRNTCNKAANAVKQCSIHFL